jgi:hypothetical protein
MNKLLSTVFAFSLLTGAAQADTLGCVFDAGYALTIKTTGTDARIGPNTHPATVTYGPGGARTVAQSADGMLVAMITIQRNGDAVYSRHDVHDNGVLLAPMQTKGVCLPALYVSPPKGFTQ